MAKLTEKNLIGQIKELNSIKPRNEWVILAKSEIFNSSVILSKARIQDESTNSGFRVKPGMTSWFFGLKAQKGLAYSFATLAFAVVAFIGFAQYTMPGDLLFPVRKITEHSEAALTGQTAMKQNFAVLNNRIKDLAKAAKEGKTENIPPAISEIKNNASELAKTLRDNPSGDTETIKEIAASLKVLADVTGAEELSENQGVKDLYQAIVENQIADLDKITLTETQSQNLIQIKELYEQGDYVLALERILSINDIENIPNDLEEGSEGSIETETE